MAASFLRSMVQGTDEQSKACQFGSFWSTQTNMQRHFGITTTALREATIRTLMDDLDRTLQLVEYDIAAEEERAGICDRTDARYPVLAGALASRRDNLKVTIAALAQQLATISEGRTDDALDRLGCAS
jgi:hypothetical protein